MRHDDALVQITIILYWLVEVVGFFLPWGRSDCVRGEIVLKFFLESRASYLKYVLRKCFCANRICTLVQKPGFGYINKTKKSCCSCSSINSSGVDNKSHFR